MRPQEPTSITAPVIGQFGTSEQKLERIALAVPDGSPSIGTVTTHDVANGTARAQQSMRGGTRRGVPRVDCDVGAADLTIKEQVAVSYESGVEIGPVRPGELPLSERKALHRVVAPKRYLPRYVRACQQGSYSVALWNKNGPRELRVVPYKCRSWRCNGECARCAAAVTFARIKTALDRVPAEHVCFLVLTLDPSQWKPRKGHTAVDRMYLESNALWAKLRKRLRRAIGRFDFVTVVEQHASTRPHFNVAIVSKKLASLLAACRSNAWKRKWLETNAVECGFGPICYAELARDRDAIAGYIVKVAGGGSNAISGEISKGTQLPLAAPRGFRRIRSSVGFLPPKIKNENLTGEMVFQSADAVLAAVDGVRADTRSTERAKALAAARLRDEVVDDYGVVAVDLLEELQRPSRLKFKHARVLT